MLAEFGCFGFGTMVWSSPARCDEIRSATSVLQCSRETFLFGSCQTPRGASLIDGLPQQVCGRPVYEALFNRSGRSYGGDFLPPSDLCCVQVLGVSPNVV